MTVEKVIEVKVTAEDVEKMRAAGVTEEDLCEVGSVKRYRPARHLHKATERDERQADKEKIAA